MYVSEKQHIRNRISRHPALGSKRTKILQRVEKSSRKILNFIAPKKLKTLAGHVRLKNAFSYPKTSKNKGGPFGKLDFFRKKIAVLKHSVEKRRNKTKVTAIVSFYTGLT